MTGRTTGSVLGAQIDALTRLLGWAHAHESRYVTICNVHVVVSASRDAGYRDIINGSDMATPDGAPVAWMLRRQGFAGQRRISGPDLMWGLCERCGDAWKMKARCRQWGGACGQLDRGWPVLNLKRSGVNDVCGDYAMRDT